MRLKSIKKYSHLLFIPLVWLGCNTKSNKEDASYNKNTEENMLAEQNENLYKSKEFTESGGFPSGIEGPAVDRNGILYAVNFEKRGTIGMVSPDGKATLFVQLPEGSVGNGIRFNRNGDMLIADYTG